MEKAGLLVEALDGPVGGFAVAPAAGGDLRFEI